MEAFLFGIVVGVLLGIKLSIDTDRAKIKKGFVPFVDRDGDVGWTL